jgi:hypothetical protein
MIVRELPNNQLLCIHQTTHALMAEELCRDWGNGAFAKPEPYSVVMLGIAQHDNGWYEWELQPKLRNDGYPEDFLHESDLNAKLQLWRRGIARLYAQHPYAALLLSRHAVLLYQGDLANADLPADARRRTEEFVEEQTHLLATVRSQFGHRQFGDDAYYATALSNETLDANTWLLKFGDSASLQVIIPWAAERTLPNCPVDFQGTATDIRMTYDDETIRFDPWPFGVDEFTVSVHGKVLNQRTFHAEAEYHAALAQAPYHRLAWTVLPASSA